MKTSINTLGELMQRTLALHLAKKTDSTYINGQINSEVKLFTDSLRNSIDQLNKYSHESETKIILEENAATPNWSTLVKFLDFELLIQPKDNGLRAEITGTQWQETLSIMAAVEHPTSNSSIFVWCTDGKNNGSPQTAELCLRKLLDAAHTHLKKQ